jgi:hypothetical protein
VTPRCTWSTARLETSCAAIPWLVSTIEEAVQAVEAETCFMGERETGFMSEVWLVSHADTETSKKTRHADVSRNIARSSR